MATYPTSAKVFTTKNPGDTIQSATIDDLQDEVTAIEQDLIAGLPVARGGTGTTTHTSGSLLVGAGTAAVTSTLTPSVNNVIFPAVQVPSAGANTLDDYEEGTWTPVIGGSGGTSGQTYATQVGLYVKVGQLVTATFSVQLSVKGTITTNAQISGFPFAAHASFGAMAAVGFSSLAAAKVLVMAEIAGGASVATLYGIGAADTGVFTNLTTSDIDNSTILRGQLVYRAAA